MNGKAQENETPWRKAIPQSRDRLQSKLLVAAMLPVLVMPFLAAWRFIPGDGPAAQTLLAFGISLTFGIVVWALRSATQAAAYCGSAICFLVIVGTQQTSSPIRSGLSPLFALFVLTFAATRAGRVRKRLLGLAEGKKGGNAAQVVANLGASALVVLAATFDLFDPFLRRGGGLISPSLWVGKVLLLAALSEATADTVSSEIGQAFGGSPFLIYPFRQAQTGDDGAISLVGTTAGIAAAAIVTVIGVWSMTLTFRDGLIAFLAGVAGLFFDSLLGATVEREGWLGNDLVNFASTLFAAAIALIASAAL